MGVDGGEGVVVVVGSLGGLLVEVWGRMELGGRGGEGEAVRTGDGRIGGMCCIPSSAQPGLISIAHFFTLLLLGEIVDAIVEVVLGVG